MFAEIQPLGSKCNLSCAYCYQKHHRQIATDSTYDIGQLMSVLDSRGVYFAIFGGEPLLIPEDELESLFKLGMEKYNSNTIQTNGTLINTKHIEMFKKYNVKVGVSMDGPGECNGLRQACNPEKTGEYTQSTEKNIERLCKEKVPVSIIVTLHKKNAVFSKLDVMCDWLRRMKLLGVRHVRLHIMEIEDSFVRENYALTPKENVHALLKFADLETELGKAYIDVFGDIRDMLSGKDTNASCVWRGCDYYNTRAVNAMDSYGGISSCGRTKKEGISFLKTEKENYFRYIALYSTPQKYGGCQRCRFFLVCKGQCPGTAIDSDWRNRTEYCTVWKSLFIHFEKALLKEGKIPVSALPCRKAAEKAMVKAWISGYNPALSSILEELSKS